MALRYFVWVEKNRLVRKYRAKRRNIELEYDFHQEMTLNFRDATSTFRGMNVSYPLETAKSRYYNRESTRKDQEFFK